MNRRLRVPVTLAVGVLLFPPGLAAQEGGPPPPAQAQQDSVELRAEREVFAYPEYERRNPFKPLTGTEGGPRFEQMRLNMIIYSEEPGRSVALLAIGSAAQVSETGIRTAGTGQSARLRVGERWGNVRVVQILQDRILVDVTEFGLAERREIRLQTRGQGGSQ